MRKEWMQIKLYSYYMQHYSQMSDRRLSNSWARFVRMKCNVVLVYCGAWLHGWKRCSLVHKSSQPYSILYNIRNYITFVIQIMESRTLPLFGKFYLPLTGFTDMFLYISRVPVQFHLSQNFQYSFNFKYQINDI